MTLQDLITAVEGAKAGSRELDAEIVVAFDMRPDWVPADGKLWIDRTTGLDDPPIRYSYNGRWSPGNPPIGQYPAFTTSLDAAVELIERKLPGWCWRSQPTTASLVDDESETPAIHAEAATPALALCAALLRAVQSQAQENRKDVS